MKRLLNICAVLLVLPYVSLAQLIPDTGQTKCYDNTQEITCPQTGEDFYGQDAHYPCNPHSYTKLDENGNDLSDSATEWVMVRDNVTGLIWEVKQDKDDIQNYANPNDADNEYTWYDGVSGTPGDGTDTEDFINALNNSQFGEYNDWRVPTIKELSFIRNMGTYNPAIESIYFPNTVNIHYWSSTSSVRDNNDAWNLHLTSGAVNPYLKQSFFHVLAVRGEQFSNNLIDNGDGTVTDVGKGLMWENKTIDNIDNRYTWQDALSYCENLTLAGYDDWRMPDINELQSITNYNTYSSAIDPIFFNAAVSMHFYYLSSTTPSDERSSLVWYVGFINGAVLLTSKSNNVSVRAVRSFADSDADGIPDAEDNCFTDYNPDQEDSFPPQGNGIGDECECESDFDCDGDVDGSDATTFKLYFGRNPLFYPCDEINPCQGDFDCDGDSDGTDAGLYKEDFGRNEFNNPCPACEIGDWCSY